MKKLIISLALVTAALAVNAQNKDSIPQSADTGFNKQQTLKEVVISTKKPYVEAQIDKTVINVDSRPTMAGQNALGLLKQAPGVIVNSNEQISLSGKSGVNVFIDGRPTDLKDGDLAQLLKSIDASNIKQVEIITNPSARFDAAGNAGIINIRLKKSLVNGMNGNVTAGMQHSNHARQNLSSNFNVRKDKWNFFANTALSRGYQITYANNDRTNGVQVFTQRGDEKDRFRSINSRLGADYSLSKRHIIGVLWMINQHSTDLDNYNHTVLSRTGAADTNVFAKSFAPFRTGRNNLNLNYKYTGSTSELNVDADYTRYTSSLYNKLQTSFTDAVQSKYAASNIHNNVNVGINIYSIRADYSKKLEKIGGKFEAGFKSAGSRTANNLVVISDENGSWGADTGKSNRFRFSENINAAYANFSGSWKKWSLQTGLRMEHTRVKGVSTDLKNNKVGKPDTSYLNLFPTVFVQYDLGKDRKLGFSFGRRIDRPGYQDQNPFIYFLDAYNSQRGNPYLLPQISNGAEFTYTGSTGTMIKLKYSITERLTEQITFQDGQNTIKIPQNVGRRQTYNIAFSTPFTITKWWSGYLQAEPYYQTYKGRLSGFGTDADFSTAGPGINGYIGNWFSFNGGYSAELSSWFSYSNVSTIYRSRPLASVSIAVQKSVLKNRGSVNIGINDLFNTERWQQTVSNGSLQMQTYRKWESRNVSVVFSYKFGNQKIKRARTRETGVEAEIKRIK